MGRTHGPVSKQLEAFERELQRLRREVAGTSRRLRAQDDRIRRMGREAADQGRRLAIVSEALQLGPRARKGDRGAVAELQASIVRLEDYLIKTSERIENILSALKQHRELLVTMNKRVHTVGTKDRIRLELDVMKNTLSILALNGIDLDTALVRDIDKLRASVPNATDLDVLEKAKADLDKKFGDELKKFDLDAIWSKRKEIPGYG